MKHSKQLLSATVLSAAVLGGGIFAVSASAATNTDRADSLASKIATKFNLNKDDVKKVIDEDRAAHQAERKAERQTRVEERLSKAVTDGKITEDQKTKILEYLKSQESFFESLKDMSEDERKSAIQTHREEVKKWASDNGIDEKYVMFGGGHGGHMGGPRGMMHDKGGEAESDSSTN